MVNALRSGSQAQPVMPWVLSAVVLGIAAPLAQAASLDISGRWRPDGPGDGFENTTPVSGYCLEFGGCGPNEASIRLPVEYGRQVISGLPPLASRWSLLAPPEARVTLTSETGATLNLRFQLTHLAQILGGNGFTAYENPAFHWSAGGGCRFMTSQGFDGNSAMGFVWEVLSPNAPTLCYPTSGGVSEGQRPIEPWTRSFSFGYRLLLPAMYSVPAGRYSGSLTWSVGENADLALGGPLLGLTTDSLTLRFDIDVEHRLSVVFDQTAVALAPRKGSWAQWLANGVPADAQLTGRLPLHLSASGPFALYLGCGRAVSAGDCALMEPSSGDVAAVVTRLTLPSGLEQEGAPVSRLRLHEHVRYLVKAKRPITAELGEVEFHTAHGEVSHMIKHGGATYSGAVVLYFDAQLP